jgi:CCR4-NOT transcription complex subunit 3
MFELSFENIPDIDPFEEEQSEEYQPRNPKPSTPPYFPQTVPSIFNDPLLFEKFDLDTLFFSFYYQQGSYQQYLAAKELKRQMWRFHKKYLTWFQREEEPKVITADYEQGTYVYFDYETGWCQRKKAEFTFEYKYLEDKDLV